MNETSNELQEKSRKKLSRKSKKKQKESSTSSSVDIPFDEADSELPEEPQLIDEVDSQATEAENSSETVRTAESNIILPQPFHLKWQWLAGFFVLLTVAISLLYMPSINGPFIFDDKTSIEYDTNIRLKSLDFSSIKKMVNRISPRRSVPVISFALNYYAHEFRTFGYHLVNVIIHILAAFFLFLFIQITLGLDTKFRNKANRNTLFFISAASALLWAIHPLQTQSVSYIVQRMNSMAGLFFVLSMLCYVKARITSGKTSLVLFSTSFIAAILAILSKENAGTLPFFILLYEWYFFKDLSLDIKKIKYLLATSLVTFSGGMIFFFLWNVPEKIAYFYTRQPFTLEQRLLTELRVVCFYISQLFFPHVDRLSLEHEFPLSYSFIDPISTIFSGLLLLVLLILGVVLAKRERLLSFCILWFFGNHVIESSVIGLALVFEHRMYIPSMILILGASLVFVRLVRLKWTQIVVLSICVISLSYVTYQRNILWGNEFLFGKDLVGKNPGNSRAHYNLGKTLEAMKRFDEAIIEYNEALKTEPGNAYAHNNLGSIYQDRGQVDKAIYHFKRANHLKPNNEIVKGNLRFLLKYKEMTSKKKKNGQP